MDTHKQILRVLRNRPARRSLFGPVDREQLQVEYQAALCKDLEEASERWGFDFISDKPLESSDFQWEGVPSTRVPLLYRSCMHDLGKAEGQRSAERMVTAKRGRVETPQSEKENIPSTPEKCTHSRETLEKTPEKSESTGLKRKQTNITDFYQAKRRVVGMPRKSGE
ncbi:cyclin-dependent kinase inhibitor 1 isoform X2 [Archocentrus centrarchus]|nr:cyclin-dependent kinase inhibitor 1-like isoform X2 [Archocentrus centrarchus]